MASFFDVLFLSKERLNILRTVELYNIKYKEFSHDGLVSHTYSANGHDMTVSVRQIIFMGRPVRTILSEMHNTVSGMAFVANQEENTFFANRVFAKMKKKYNKQATVQNVR